MLRLILIAATVVLCVNGQHMSGHSQMAMNSTSLPIPDSCVTDPTQANCTMFKYPHVNAVADLESLCTAMHFMSACSVAKACNASGAGPDNPTGPGALNVSAQDPQICRIFNQVATVCRLDTGMSRMKGCTNYNTMCANGTKVPNCQNMTGIAVIPPTRIVNERVRSVCESMPHTGCELCLPSWQRNETWGDCDLLQVYDSICGEMPDMEECAEWNAMCNTDPTLIFCKSHPDFAGGRAALVNATAGPSNAAAGNATSENATIPGTQATTARSGTTAAVAQIGVVILSMAVALLLA